MSSHHHCKVFRNKFLYYLKFTVIFSLCSLHAGCLYIEHSRENVVEEKSVDIDALALEVIKKADELSLKLEEESEILSNEHPLVNKAKSSLDKISQLYNSQDNIRQYDAYDEYSQRYSMLDRIGESALRVNVIVDDDAFAQVFPNGRIYITSGLIDPDSPNSVENDTQLLGVLAHEFSHLRNGDVLWQWISIEARKRELWGKLSSDLTKLIPIFEYNYGSAVTYENLDKIDELIEYKSDMEAIRVLEELNYDPREYAAYIGRYRYFDNREKKEEAEIQQTLKRREICMGIYFSPKNTIFKYPRTTVHYENKKIVILPVYRVISPKTISNFERYDLCAQVNVLLSNQDKDQIISWLQQPKDRTLNDLMTTVSESAAKVLELWMDKTMYKRFNVTFER